MNRRKELILAYKQIPRPMGVYLIKNNITGKIFIGSSMNLPGSFNSNRFKLKAKAHPNKALQADWDLLGPDAFTFDVLETIDPEKIAQDEWRKAVSALEEKWLERLQPYDNKGYNKQKKTS